MAGRWKAPSPTDAKRAASAKSANEVIAQAAIAEAEAKRLAKIRKEVQELEKKREIGKKSVKANTDAKAASKADLINYLNSIGNPVPPTLAQAKIIAGYQKSIDEREAEAKRQQKQLDEINAKIKELLASRKPVPFVPKFIFKPKDEKPAPTPPPTDYAGVVYKYNLPMLNSAYLSPYGPQGKSVLDRTLLAAPNYSNGRRAWDGVTASRGTIQTSKMFAENALTSDQKAAAKKEGRKFSENPYGFRFLYNPTDVSMAWGIVDAFSPQYAASGANGMTGVAAGLMKGTIAFTLILNRIQDMSIIYPDGSYVQDMYEQLKYQKDPSQSETKMIYDRGTMYDIEYLFRAMNPYYSDYQSGLNGITADKGWLQPIPMELHLGAGLRYLVRVSSLDLKHMMFNERMVPILTTVNIVCIRYYDTATGLNQNGEFDSSVFNPESPGSTSTS